MGVQLPQGGRAEERKVAQEWIDAFVRRNTAELPAIEEEEQIVAVRQTPKAGRWPLWLAAARSGRSMAASPCRRRWRGRSRP